MKKLFTTAIAAVLLFSLCSCGASFTLDTAKLADEIRGAGFFLDSLAPVSENVIKKVVGLSTDSIAEFVYEIGTGATGEEFAVITCKSESDAKKIRDEIVKRQEDLYNTYESYSPESLPRITNAVVEQKGVYVIFVSCDKDNDAQKLVDSFLK